MRRTAVLAGVAVLVSAAVAILGAPPVLLAESPSQAADLLAQSPWMPQGVSLDTLFGKADASATPRIATAELIILLELDGPSPFDVVNAVNGGRDVPGGLGIGNPRAARKAIREPARGRLAQWISHNPNSAEGRLQRYIVVEYPAQANLDAIMRALSHNPFVQHVEPNYLLQLHAVPNDPFIGQPTDPPDLSQYGIFLSNLPAAWDVMKGHAYIGIVDEGLQVSHEDLRHTSGPPGSLSLAGGSIREHLSRDVLNEDPGNGGRCSVDENDPGDIYGDDTPGHGSHVTGLASATTDNDLGVAGTCRRCSVLSTKFSPVAGGGAEGSFETAFRGLRFYSNHGVQVVNMSFGSNLPDVSVNCSDPAGGAVNLSLFCDALETTNTRDVVMVASSGNRISNRVDFPARDPRTIAAGGLQLDPITLEPEIWNDGCPVFTQECGSNWGPNQDLMAPAKEVLSTVYAGFDHNTDANNTDGCGDSYFTLDGPDGGYGLCTGTSMSAPFLSGIAGLVRSANPLLPKEDVRDVLTSTASIPGTKDPQLGHGIPDAAAAVDRAFGDVSGMPLRNRLTPLFALHGDGIAPMAETHAYTTVPQVGSAFLINEAVGFDTVGTPVEGYTFFPGFCEDDTQPDCCPIDQPCCVGQPPECEEKILVTPDTEPRAEVFVFTNDKAPAPFTPPLVPLYRLRYESDWDPLCPSPPDDLASTVRDFAYATSTAEVELFLNGIDLGGTTYRYLLDGVEGYVYENCDSGCRYGEVSLHRLYHSTLHDMVVVPQDLLGSYATDGYFPVPAASGLPEILGWAYRHTDTDGDGLIDGFERLIGTNRLFDDSDGDDESDGEELLFYDASPPDPALHGYGDPCSNGCPIFTDGFESGDATAWSGATP